MSEEENDTQWELAAWEMLAEAKEQLKAERALADRLAMSVQILRVMLNAFTDGQGTELGAESLEQWKAARAGNPAANGPGIMLDQVRTTCGQSPVASPDQNHISP